MLNINPIKNIVLRGFTGRKTYKDVSDQSWILCPGERSSTPPAIYLEGQLDKIEAIAGFISSFKFEETIIKGLPQGHLPTVAYQLRDVHLSNGHLYKGAMKHSVLPQRDSLFHIGINNYVDKAALACSFDGNEFFGDWMSNDLILSLAAQDLADAITAQRKSYYHEEEYCRLFGIKSRSFIRVKCNELFIIDDVGQNKYKKQRYSLLREKLKSSLIPVNNQHCVMLKRGSSGAIRQLTNEIEVEEFLKSLNFTIIDPEKSSASDIARNLLGAKIVIGVEGSQMAHALFSIRDGGTIFTLQPPFRFNSAHKQHSDCIGLRYAFVVGDSDDSDPFSFSINIEDLAHTLDKVDAVI